ncbi:MAG: thioredoxin [Erysipelotrichia bacterium]|nr:thioredoxin [Erysipelotrichia bacterium]NCC55117.1 thioredoxin [Erysipelotrichia bacterium]
MKKLLYFFAPWCNPCKFADKEVITPLTRNIGEEKVERINVELEPHRADLYNVDKYLLRSLLTKERRIIKMQE